MATDLLVLLIVEILTIGIFVRRGEQVYTLRRQAKSRSTRMLLSSWIVWSIAMALIAAFLIFLAFGRQLLPAFVDWPHYRLSLIVIIGTVQLGTAIVLELLWRRMTR